MNLFDFHQRQARRIAVALGCFAVGAVVARAQTPDAAPATAAEATPTKPKYAALQDELALYSPLESPWADRKPDHAFESHLFNLLRVEVRLWALHDQLATADAAARDTADEIARIIHAQVLSVAAEAVLLLRKTPNQALAALLVHQLEAYPYEWREEGSEELLPDLHKLIDPPTGKPAPAVEHRRRRRRPVVD